MTDNMKILQDKFIDDSEILLSHSVNEKDNVAVLNEYAKENGCFSKWHLLTGDKEAIYSIAKKTIFCRRFYWIFEKQMILHTENLFCRWKTPDSWCL
jgi:protein SCO1/2